MLKTIIYIGAGSCIGGIARYLLSRWIDSYACGGFPWATFIVNLSGCLAIGLIYGLLDNGFNLSPEMKAFLTVGLCGGFTTFSTFVHENYMLLGSSQQLSLSLYAIASFAAGLMCVHAGHWMAKAL